MSPAQLAALAPAPLATQSAGWSIVGAKVAARPHSQQRRSQERAAAAAAPAGPLPAAVRHQQSDQQQKSNFRFDFERQLAAGGTASGKLPAPDEIDDAISHQPPTADELPANYAFGDVGRLLRRYSQQGSGPEFDISHGLAGPAQVSIPCSIKVASMVVVGHEQHMQCMQRAAGMLSTYPVAAYHF